MASPRHHLLPYCLLCFLYGLFGLSVADVGTAAVYRPPYIPTACFGKDRDQFPPDNVFAAAGEAIWGNGAACGRRYLVKCLGSAVAGACAAGQPVVEVKIVDRATATVSPPSQRGATMVLSMKAFQAVANASARGVTRLNIEYTQIG